MSKFARNFLNNVRYRTPCPLAEEPFAEGQTVRHCSQCDRDVVDLSAMSRAEAEQVMAAPEGPPCVRVVVDRRTRRALHRPALAMMLLAPAVAVAQDQIEPDYGEITGGVPIQEEWEVTGGDPSAANPEVTQSAEEALQSELYAMALDGAIPRHLTGRIERKALESPPDMAAAMLTILRTNAVAQRDDDEWLRLMRVTIAHFGTEDSEQVLTWVVDLRDAGQPAEAARLAQMLLDRDTGWTGKTRRRNERILIGVLAAQGE